MAEYEPRRERPARLHTLGVGAFLFLCATATLPREAGAGVAPIADETFGFAADGSINATAWANGDLVVGGYFRRIGPATGGCVLLGHDDARVIPAFPRVRGSVLAIQPDGEGGWLIGGEFDAVGTTPALNLAHLRADGTVVGWKMPHLSPVICLARAGHRLYFGGEFGAWSLDMRSGARLPWDPRPDAPVRAIVVSGDSVVLGGDFSFLGDLPRPALASVDLDQGTPGSWSPDLRGRVFDVAIDEGELLVAGELISAAGNPLRNLASFDLRSGRLLDWKPATTGMVTAIAVHGDRVVIGGVFGQVGGARRRSLGAVDRRTGHVTSWAPAGPVFVGDIAVHGRRVYVAGSQVPAGVDFLMAFDDVTGQAVAWDPGLIDVARALAVDERGVLVGGNFRAANAVERMGLAKLDLSRRRVAPWRTKIESSVNLLAAHGNTLHAVGAFFESSPHHHLATFDLRTGEHRLWPTRLSGRPRSMTVGNGSVYVTGDLHDDRTGVRHLIAFDPGSGMPRPWNAFPDGPVLGIAVVGGELFVAGEFDRIGGADRTGLAALDARTGLATSWRAQIPHRRAAVGIMVQGETVVASGINRIAAYDRREGSLLWWDYRFHQPFHVDRGYVYVSNLFVPGYGGVSRLDLHSGVWAPPIAPELMGDQDLGVEGPWIWAVHYFTEGSQVDLMRWGRTNASGFTGEAPKSSTRGHSIRGASGGLELTLPDAAEIRVTLYDVLGRRRVERDLGVLSPGIHRWSVAGQGLAPGVYFARVRVNGAWAAGVRIAITR